jgi:colicin import membrane protein
MLILSGVFHLFLGLGSLVVSAHQGRQMRLEPVTVVNLVGGGDFPREVEKASPAKEGPATAPPATAPPATAPPAKSPPAKSAPDRKDDFPLKTPPAKAKSPAKKPPAAEPAELSSVAERLRTMREARDDSDSVRRAVEERRGEAAARSAVRGIGERVARRIEGPPAAVVPAVRGGAGAGFGGGSQGTARVSPELLEFFRKLEERVRESWTLPEALVRDAGKLMVEMRIVIEKDGRVSDTRIEKGSGNVYFDESVRRAIRKASPLPVPPERLRGGEDYYEVGFRFHGTGGRG